MFYAPKCLKVNSENSSLQISWYKCHAMAICLSKKWANAVLVGKGIKIQRPPLVLATQNCVDVTLEFHWYFSDLVE